MHGLDERFDLERQIVRLLCLEIAAGVWRTGECVPTPADLATRLLVGPKRLETAYGLLCDLGILTRVDSERYAVADGAATRGRGQFLAQTRDTLREVSADLRRAGLDSAEILRFLETAMKETGKP